MNLSAPTATVLTVHRVGVGLEVDGGSPALIFGPLDPIAFAAVKLPNHNPVEHRLAPDS